MVVLAAAALAIQAPHSGVTATVQATATIRVLRAVTLKLDGSANPEAPPVRDAVIASADGTHQVAKLIDFQ
ncbi:MAG TPA: hypothetical protein VF750_05105 [Sphingomicrobium sp.]